MTFGEGHFGAPTVLSEGAELQTFPAEDRITAPAPGATAPLSAGPLVEANTAVFNAATGEEYTLGLDYFEVLSTRPGEIENIRIPEGTGLRVSYFAYQASGVDGTSVAPVLPPAQTITATRPRFSTTLKFGG